MRTPRFNTLQAEHTFMPSDTSEAEKAANTDGPPPEARRQREREPLDFSPSSGPPGSIEKIRDVEDPISHDGRAKTETTFYANQGNDNYDWEKLAKINDGLFNEESRLSGRDEQRKKELKQMVETMEGHGYHVKNAIPTQQRKAFIHRLINCYEDFVTQRDNGIKVGSMPEEATMIAMITVVCRDIIKEKDIETLDDLDPENPINDTVLQTEITERLIDEWAPVNVDIDIKTIRSLRNTIQESR